MPFGTAIAISIPLNQDDSGSSPINGPYLLCDNTDYLLANGTPMLLA